MKQSQTPLVQSMMVNVMDVDKVVDIIDSLYPTPEEYSDNEKFFYWMDYACELDVILFKDGPDRNSYVAGQIQKLKKDTAGHDANTDVASTLLERYPTEYKGVFYSE